MAFNTNMILKNMTKKDKKCIADRLRVKSHKARMPDGRNVGA